MTTGAHRSRTLATVVACQFADGSGTTHKIVVVIVIVFLLVMAVRMQWVAVTRSMIGVFVAVVAILLVVFGLP